ncbi:hypothetical protein PIB30_021001 [Stylosanthes scabra]|uniref:Uncharacterized protein n=1 Tax=Stylosanthes scabra TaxID=79078 RepID=A0ABU6T8F3_9FABA|nr:hypothetical protein [Stylosanthes scabra]
MWPETVLPFSNKETKASTKQHAIAEPRPVTESVGDFLAELGKQSPLRLVLSESTECHCWECVVVGFSFPKMFEGLCFACLYLFEGFNLGCMTMGWN